MKWFKKPVIDVPDHVHRWDQWQREFVDGKAIYTSKCLVPGCMEIRTRTETHNG
jgi:hypothetical protein